MGDVYNEYSGRKLSPLDGYLENEKISYSQLINFVKSMGRRAKKPFKEALATISKKCLEGKQNIKMISISSVIGYMQTLKKNFQEKPP